MCGVETKLGASKKQPNTPAFAECGVPGPVSRTNFAPLLVNLLSVMSLGFDGIEVKIRRIVYRVPDG